MNLQRNHAELEYAEELALLDAQDSAPRPANWKLSPQALVNYIIDGQLKKSLHITPK